MSATSLDVGQVLADWFARRHRPGDPLSPVIWRQALLNAVQEFVSRPGNGWRGQMVTGCWQLAGNREDLPPAELAGAVELIHAGSLILDDIEDDAQVRRNQPALHRVHGVPIAINTGSWLVFAATDILADAKLPADIHGRLQQLTRGMLLDCHEGQALDLALPISAMSVEQVAGIVQTSTYLRTASLTRFAAELGAIASGGTVTKPASDMGFALGVGLQMLDDLGGLLDPKRAAKGDEDLRNRRATWPWAWIAELTPERWAEWLERLGQVSAGDADPDGLRTDLGAAVEDLGRARAREQLAMAKTALDCYPPRQRGHASLAELVQRLETRYG